MPAPTDFTVAQIMGHSDAPWKGNDGTMMMTHEVRFEGDEQTWKIYHPADDGVDVAAGATLKGWKNSDKGTFGLAKPRAPGGRSGGQAPRSEGPGRMWQSKPYERGAEHPRNEVRVIHTSALSATPKFIEQLLTIGAVDQPKNEEEYWALVGKVAGRLTASYKVPLEQTEKVQTELPVATESPPKPAPQVPADTDGLEPQPQVADDKIPF